MAAKNKKFQPLSPKEETFLEEYLRSWNGAAAARKAGYPSESARQVAHELLTKPYILAAKEGRLKELRMSTDEWFARVTEQARGDLGDFLRDDGTIDLSAAREQTRLLSEYQEETSTRPNPDGEPTITVKKKIKLYSAQRALQMLGERIAVPEAKQSMLEAQVALLENKLEELQKREVLLAFLEQNATPEVYQEVLRLLTGGPQAKRSEGGGKTLTLRWQDERAPHDPGAQPVPPAEGDSDPSGPL